MKIPLTVSATDFVNCKPVYFSDGEIVPVLLGSCAMPAFYPPVEYRNLYLIEGGLTNNLPVEPLFNKCDVIIGSHVNHLNKGIEKLTIPNVIDRSFHISVSESVNRKMKHCRLFIEPPALSKFNILDMDEAKSIFDIGYNFTIAMKKEIEKLL